MRRLLLTSAALAALAAFPLGASAQSEQEARLREALRRATTELRGLQDAQARLQAEATAARAGREAMEAELTTARARIAELEAQQPTGPSPEAEAEMERLRAAARAAAEQNAAFQAVLGRWQAAANEAANVARQKEAERAATEVALTRARAALDAAEAKNTQLFRAANDILRLYETPEFRSLVTRSGEPLLGFWRVRLENIVQEHEDKIREGRFHRAAHPVPEAPPGSAMPPALQERSARARRSSPPASAQPGSAQPGSVQP
jgi:chromosome segregation ATPase